MIEQRRPGIPRHLVRSPGDIVAIARRHRDRFDRRKAETGRKIAILGADPFENLLVVADQIQLVHGKRDMADSEQRGDDGVSAGLPQNTPAGIHKNDGEIGSRGAGRHVARILLMPRRIGDDELALRSGEEAVCDVDGDALLPFGLQTVDQEREVDVGAVGAVFPGILFQRGQAGPRRSAWCRRAGVRSA